MKDIRDAILAGRFADVGGLEVPEHYQGVTVRAEDADMFEGLTTKEKDPRKSLRVEDVPDAPLIADAPDVPREHALQGFAGVRAYTRDPSRSAALLGDTLGFSGGEDSLFTGQLDRAGVPMVWATGAVVTDHVPADRLTRGYVLHRTAALAGTGVHSELALRGSARERLRFRLRTGVRETARLRLARDK